MAGDRSILRRDEPKLRSAEPILGGSPQARARDAYANETRDFPSLVVTWKPYGYPSAPITRTGSTSPTFHIFAPRGRFAGVPGRLYSRTFPGQRANIQPRRRRSRV